jgi:hypothetical protein
VYLAGGSGADCLTVTVCPAIVVVCDCAAVVVFVEVATVTTPLPSPLAGETMTPASFAIAVHADGEHPAGAAATVTTWDPPPALKLTASGETTNEQATPTLTA